LPAIIVIGTPASRRSMSAAKTRTPLRGTTLRHSNQNSNRSPLMSSDPGAAGQEPQKGEKRSLDALRRMAEMHVGNHIAGRLEHGAFYMARAVFTNNSASDNFAPHLYELHDTYSRDRAQSSVCRDRPHGCGLLRELSRLVRGGRVELLRALGRSYAALEAEGIGLAVSEATVRYLSPARFDDRVRVETTLTGVRSRAVTFDYLIANAETGARLATAHTALVSIDRDGRLAAIPQDFRRTLESVL
jgi:acyl-CoA thioester hydrolase